MRMLHCFEKEESLTNSWRYRLFIGKLNYLEKSTAQILATLCILSALDFAKILKCPALRQ